MQEKKIFIASDHGGFQLKETLKTYLASQKCFVTDLGAHSLDSVNYPDYAQKVVEALKDNPEAVGILICTSGIGMSIAANRYPFIRAALVSNTDMAYLSRAHNNANVLVFGAKFILPEEAKKCASIFLSTEFEGGRHCARVDALERMGK